MTPGTASVEGGNSVDFTVGTSGGVANATASWTCTSSNTGIATVATTGTGCRATGVGTGGVVISAAVTNGNETVNVGVELRVTLPPAIARGCPAGSPAWMGLLVCEEGVRVGYDRDAFGTSYSLLEDEIIISLPKSGGQVYTPYTCTLFDIEPDGTAATDIEHTVALAEAYDSGLAESQFRLFAGDIDNLTIAVPGVNRSQKADRDAGEWTPPRNRGWFAARVVAAKQKYGLSVNPAERDSLQAMLGSDAGRSVTCG